MDIRMAGADLRLEYGNFLAAAGDSYCHLSAFVGDLFEGAPVAVQFGFLPESVCHRWMITSTYFGSSSMPRQTRSVRSAAARVVPLPRKGS